jgi:ribonuclease HII
MGWITDKLDNKEYVTVQSLYDHFGFTEVLGVASSGRKSISGPICSAAVILPYDHELSIRPIHTIPKARFRELAHDIRDIALYLEVGWADNYSIERMGKDFGLRTSIVAATSLIDEGEQVSMAFVESHRLDPPPKALSRTSIVYHKDLNRLVDIAIAAEIMAKYSKEEYMRHLSEQYPEYNWNKNYGYPTVAHIAAIKAYGITPYHRELKNIKALRGLNLLYNC